MSIIAIAINKPMRIEIKFLMTIMVSIMIIMVVTINPTSIIIYVVTVVVINIITIIIIIVIIITVISSSLSSSLSLLLAVLLLLPKCYFDVHMQCKNFFAVVVEAVTTVVVGIIAETRTSSLEIVHSHFFPPFPCL